MDNGTNPVVGLNNTVVPAVAVAFAVNAAAKPIMEHGVKGLAKAAGRYIYENNED